MPLRSWRPSWRDFVTPVPRPARLRSRSRQAMRRRSMAAGKATPVLRWSSSRRTTAKKHRAASCTSSPRRTSPRNCGHAVPVSCFPPRPPRRRPGDLYRPHAGLRRLAEPGVGGQSSAASPCATTVPGSWPRGPSFRPRSHAPQRLSIHTALDAQRPRRPRADDRRRRAVPASAGPDRRVRRAESAPRLRGFPLRGGRCPGRAALQRPAIPVRERLPHAPRHRPDQGRGSRGGARTGSRWACR